MICLLPLHLFYTGSILILKKAILFLSIGCVFFAAQALKTPAAPLPGTGKKPRNVILMIGDGMGLTQITAGLYTNGNRLNLERCTATGLIKTHSQNRLVTDSAAGATAFSCGCKTFNGAIGVDKDKKPCQTILEQAKKEGRAVGLVATCSITHATPAAFVAHVPSRAEMLDIATFFLRSEFDCIIGGGMRYFNQRPDGRNLCTELTNKGYQVFDFNQVKMDQLAPSPLQPFAWFSAVEEPGSVIAGRDYLPAAARLTPDFLKKRSEKGFFLMIEGSQIDWACHAKDGERARREMLDFDAAIGEVLRFAQADGETLVVITADHETGGMAIEQGSTADTLEIDFATGYHTASMVPVFAFGPGAEAFNGIYENTDIYFKMAGLLGFPPVK